MLNKWKRISPPYDPLQPYTCGIGTAPPGSTARPLINDCQGARAILKNGRLHRRRRRRRHRGERKMCTEIR